MICVRKYGDWLEKYEVVFDKAKLSDLLKRVIINCGELHFEKKECEYQYIPRSDRYNNTKDGINIIHYEDVKSKKNGRKTVHYYEYTPVNEDLYDCSYTKYIAPYFAYFIERIMSGDVDALSILLDKDITAIKHFPTVREKMDRLLSTISKFENNHIATQKEKLAALNKKYAELDFDSSPSQEKYKKISKLMKEIRVLEKTAKKEMAIADKELSELNKISEINRNQEPIDGYFNELVSLVKFELIDRIEISEVDRVSSFLGFKTLETQKQRILR